MSRPAEQFISPADYLALERQAETKSEYLNGCIYAMTGASREHNTIVFNLARRIGNQLDRKPCRGYVNDMRVKVSPTGLYTYPDAVVVCGEPRFEDRHLDTLLNPTVIIEVLSDSTEAYDRGDKFAHYRTLESLTDYLLVAQDKPRIEHYSRQPDGRWLYSAADGRGARAEIAAIGCVLPLAEVYDRVEFPDPGEIQPPT
ncbi:MAG TPA: Uma2 family endonuclease [Xanthomonadaceae bacterium]|nr:Uma2 family endonuclease [Xanthomonadaceae bacterium]